MNLFVVATPIGNIKDISIRALEILESSSLILAEDTRSTKKLFSLLKIDYSNKIFLSSHAQSSQGSIEKALEECSNHKDISLVTDAGTPAISDPGSLFVDLFREKYPDSNIYPIPGASAITSAISVSGFPGNHFEFIGFIPHKKGRNTLFSSLLEKEHTVVMYESPHRILKTLESLCEHIPERYIFIAREITKVFEEYKKGLPSDILSYFKENSDKVRGEFVVIISPNFYKTIK